MGMFNITYQSGGRFDFPYYPTKGTPYIKGIRVPIYEAVTTNTYLVTEDMELLTIAVGASRYNDTDNWSLSVDNVKLFDTVYTKDVPEGFYFMVVREVKPGSEIVFTFNNVSGSSKTVWLNYQFLRN